MAGLEVRIEDSGTLPLSIARYRTARIPLDPALFREQAEDGSELPRGLEAAGGLEVVLPTLEFAPASAPVRGPADAIEALLGGGRQLAFEPVSVPADSGSGFVAALSLDPRVRPAWS